KANCSGLRLKDGLEHVGACDVFPLGAKGLSGRNPPTAAADWVEQCGKARRTVEPRPAEPIDRAEARDQSRASAVTDNGVVADRRFLHARTVARRFRQKVTKIW